MDRGAAIPAGTDVNGAFEAIHDGADDVHADAATRNFGDFGCGAEAGLKDQVHDFVFGKALRVFGFEDAALHGVLANLCEVDATAVVADFDDHLRTLMIGVEIDRAARGFAGGDTLLGAFDAMIDGVAHDVHQRLGERIEDTFVEIGVLAR